MIQHRQLPMFAPANQVKTYIELNLAALRRRQARPYALWLLARLLDTRGEGRVRERDLYHTALSIMQCSRKTITRALSRDNGLWRECFWPDWIHYASVEQVANAWKTPLQHHPVFIPLETFRTLAKLRQALHNSFFANKPHTISQSTLGTLIDRTRRTVQRYLDTPTIEKHANIATCSIKPPPSADPMPPDLASTGYFRTRLDGQIVVARHLPNTYFCPGAITAPFGQVKNQRGASSLPTGAPRRVFFTKPKAQARAIEQLIDGESIFCLKNDKVRTPMRTWQQWTCTFGITQSC